MPILDTVMKAIGLRPTEPPAETAITKIEAFPILVETNLNEQQRIDQAKYRINAMQRHVYQAKLERRPVSDQKMSEFRAEIRTLALFLLQKGQISWAQHDVIVATIEKDPE